MSITKTDKRDKKESLAVKRDRVVEIVKQNGPLLPIVIAKRLELDTTFAAAMLSELVDNKILMLTSVKYGGSPFYYAPGQEYKLRGLMKHLNEKDKEVAEFLMEKKILRDKDLNTLQRFALRQIKDFAKGVTITMNNEVDLFWKWYTINDNETKKLINDYLESKFGKAEDRKISEEIKEKIVGIKEEIKEEVHEKVDHEAIEKEIKDRKIEKDRIKVKEKVKEKVREEQAKLQEVYKPEIKPETKIERDDDPLRMFFAETQIEIMDQKILRKNKEMNYIACMNTDLGKGIFFLKYKNKGKINEADLGLALYEAGKLPLIFISNGELTKKARELLGTEFKGVIFRKI